MGKSHVATVKTFDRKQVCSGSRWIACTACLTVPVFLCVFDEHRHWCFLSLSLFLIFDEPAPLLYSYIHLHLVPWAYRPNKTKQKKTKQRNVCTGGFAHESWIGYFDYIYSLLNAMRHASTPSFHEDNL